MTTQVADRSHFDPHGETAAEREQAVKRFVAEYEQIVRDSLSSNPATVREDVWQEILLAFWTMKLEGIHTAENPKNWLKVVAKNKAGRLMKKAKDEKGPAMGETAKKGPAIGEIAKKKMTKLTDSNWEAVSANDSGIGETADAPTYRVLREMLGRVRADCTEPEWAVFNAMYLEPYRMTPPEARTAEIVAALLGRSKKSVSDALGRAKTHLEKNLPIVLKEFGKLGGSSDVETQTKDMVKAFKMRATQPPTVDLLSGGSTVVGDPMDPRAYPRGAECAVMLLSLAATNSPPTSSQNLKQRWTEFAASSLSDVLNDADLTAVPELQASPATSPNTVAELFDGKHRPSLELLKQVQSAAKKMLKRPVKTPPDQRSSDAAWPEELWSVLHYACIALAHQAYGQTITRAAPAKLRDGLKLVLKYYWVPTQLQKLFQRFDETISPAKPKPD